jgi:hypothetical protein
MANPRQQGLKHREILADPRLDSGTGCGFEEFSIMTWANAMGILITAVLGVLLMYYRSKLEQWDKEDNK